MIKEQRRETAWCVKVGMLTVLTKSLEWREVEDEGLAELDLTESLKLCSEGHFGRVESS